MKLKLSRFAPPGMDLKKWKKLFFALEIISAIYSLGFLLRYIDAKGEMFLKTKNGLVLIPGSVMPDFVSLINSSLMGFVILGVCMLLLIAECYLYFYRDSKSIYLMKRLPDKWELHKRCIVLPVVCCLLSLLSALIVLSLYYGVYMTATPKECITPGQWQKLWSVIL